MGRWFCLLIAAITTGCATAKPDYLFLSDARWREELRIRGVNPDSVPNPLLVTAPMREAAEKLTGMGDPEAKLQRLQAALFDTNAFPFRYESRDTLTAAETFHRREGNCLSFTNLFVALSRSVNLRVTTALVKRPGGSEREGDLIVIATHVVATVNFNFKPIFFDFDRRRHEPFTAFKPLNDLWITALFLNNRGADELRTSHPDIALRHFQDAVKLAPDFAAAWGNIGVAQRRLGRTAETFEAYRQALAIEPGNPTILNNLAVVYRSIGKEEEADAAVGAANLSMASPHVLLVRGDIEFSRTKYDEALRFYNRARKLGPTLADPWVAMAKVALARKNFTKARKYLDKALKLDPHHKEALVLQARMEAAVAAPVHKNS